MVFIYLFIFYVKCKLFLILRGLIPSLVGYALLLELFLLHPPYFPYSFHFWDLLHLYEQFNTTLSFYMRFMSWNMGAKCPLEEVEVIIRDNINYAL